MLIDIVRPHRNELTVLKNAVHYRELKIKADY
jgi:hypothetical protein